MAAFGPARKLASRDELLAAALRALVRRAYSIHEMREYLERRAGDSAGVSPVIASLREQGYLDDERYALEFARRHAQSRRQGPFRIIRELRARGVPDRHIESATASIFGETDQAALVRARLERLFARAPRPLDQRTLASAYRSLLRAGFSAGLIRAELRARNQIAPEFPPTDQGA